MKKYGLYLVVLVALVCFAAPAQAADDATVALYKSKCAACHGADGSGSPMGAKLNVRDFKLPEIMKASDKEMIEITSKGKNKMPAFEKKLSSDQIKLLVAYIRECTKMRK